MKSRDFPRWSTPKRENWTMQEKPQRQRQNPVHAWIGKKRATAARRLADYHRLTAEADAMEADLRYQPDADQPAPGGEK